MVLPLTNLNKCVMCVYNYIKTLGIGIKGKKVSTSRKKNPPHPRSQYVECTYRCEMTVTSHNNSFSLFFGWRCDDSWWSGCAVLPPRSLVIYRRVARITRPIATGGSTSDGANGRRRRRQKLLSAGPARIHIARRDYRVEDESTELQAVKVTASVQ